MRKILLIQLIFLYIFCAVTEAKESQKNILKLANGAKAYYLLPQNLESQKKYTLLIVLHGKGYSAHNSFIYWQDIAKKYNYIILAPQGTGVDNSYLDNINRNVNNTVHFVRMIKKKVYVKDIIVAGFSMGGGFAIDLALSHPKLFTKVLCIFGFFDERHQKKLHTVKSKYLSKQKYYFITGDKDITCSYLRNGYRKLSLKGARVQLDVYPNLFHEFPPHFKKKYPKIDSYFKGIDHKYTNLKVCLYAQGIGANDR
ncbi:MAG TPA: hypothetical protein DF296_12605 [Candidatus Margulisbacteria bacterium]|nr:MAG: hypothetical protein A2X43_12965 [Candidatus Margulisbacteria bacterium GWD2_39_127]OGI02137.1 MAG: hypothetical protein A2X42_01580 [Candidatus Margulisbacteria bacterium GWF2_38_17]HAR62402.1 hypothetical protein [Candidatus Margulisiibacteriota bacterium]HCT86024.1 hypothetical protein [Candidatus Margulisiibacteriota bacterium]